MDLIKLPINHEFALTELVDLLRNKSLTSYTTRLKFYDEMLKEEERSLLFNLRDLINEKLEE